MTRNLIIISLAFISANALAQRYPFIPYTPKDGLVYNRCRFMKQDSQGLLYIATYGGLSVYDGSRFTNYTVHDGLGSNLINDIVEMGPDSVWIIANAAPIQYLKNNRLRNVGTIKGHVPSITKFIRLKNGQLYALADEGLFLYEDNHFVNIYLHHNNFTIASPLYFTDAVEAGNKLFMITDWSLQSAAGPGRIIAYDFTTKECMQSKPMTAYAIAKSPAGDLFVCTNGGVAIVDIKALARGSFVLKNVTGTYHAASSLHASNLFFDHQDNLWIGLTNQLVKIDSASNTQTFTEYNGLPANKILAVFQDKENTLWFINEQTGVCKLTSTDLATYKELQKDFSATDIYADNKSDSLWLLDSYHNKLLLRNGIHDKTFNLGPAFSNPPARLFATDGQYKYLSDLFNIYSCNFTTNNRVRLTKIYADTNRNENASFSRIQPDGHGNLLASTQNITVVLKSGQSAIYPLEYYADGFALTKNNYLWIITRTAKLYVFCIHPEQPDRYFELLKTFKDELPQMAPRSIAADDHGNVWIGTRDSGLYHLSFNRVSLRSVANINTNDGLSDNFISYLNVDENGVLWACSPAGFDKVEMQNGKTQIDNFTRSNGIYQHVFKTYTTGNGDRWLMTLTDIIKITHGGKPSSNFQSSILFREIVQDGNLIDAATDGSFAYDRNNLSFTVAAPGYIDEHQTRFSYLLEGTRQNGWTQPSSQGMINLVNLEPGTYRLRVRSSFVGHRYSTKEIAYSFVIHPPWWRTWWFNLLAVLIGALITLLVIRRYYLYRLKRIEATFEKEQAIERERLRIASDMHDDLGAGLSTIRFLSEKVRKNPISQLATGDLDKIQHMSNELIDKMNEIVWSMNEKNNSLEDLVYFLRSYTMEYCGNNNLHCSIMLPENLPAVIVRGETRRNVFLTVKESLHNTTKHAGAQHLYCTIEVMNNLTVILKDDGRGIVGSWKTAGGNGIKNMYNRMASVGGSLQIVNEQGTCTTIKVPLTATH